MNLKRLITVITLLTLVLALAPVTVAAKGGPPGGGGGGGGGGGEETAGNNMSFPVIALDGFTITPIESTSFTVPYTGDYPDLTQAEIDDLLATGPWYPQKTEGNLWQAQYAVQTAEDVTYIDWGDNIESVNPKIRRPFRLEVTLYKQLDTSMTAYKMAVLEYPSSADEQQGTNTETYDNYFATVISTSPKLVIQYMGESVPEMTWDGTKWSSGTIVPVSFAPELNVGGKYIFGASEGGWKPAQPGYYRITFYVPSGSGVNLALAQIGNYADFSTGTPPSGEGTAATPVVDPTNNLTYVDVQVVGGGGGGGGHKP